MNKIVHKVVGSTKYLSHFFAPRVSFINLFAFIKLFIYEFLLKTTENPKDKQKWCLVTSDYTVFHGSTTKMRKHLNAYFRSQPQLNTAGAETCVILQF